MSSVRNAIVAVSLVQKAVSFTSLHGVRTCQPAPGYRKSGTVTF
jgi:hypothetical protein